VRQRGGGGPGGGCSVHFPKSLLPLTKGFPRGLQKHRKENRKEHLCLYSIYSE